MGTDSISVSCFASVRQPSSLGAGSRPVSKGIMEDNLVSAALCEYLQLVMTTGIRTATESLCLPYTAQQPSFTRAMRLEFVVY